MAFDNPFGQAWPREDDEDDVPRLLSVDVLAVEGRAPEEEGDVDVRREFGTERRGPQLLAARADRGAPPTQASPTHLTLQGLRYAAALKAFRFRLQRNASKEKSHLHR
jgi:hypothetical protein